MSEESSGCLMWFCLAHNPSTAAFGIILEIHLGYSCASPVSRIFRDYPNPPHLPGTGICLFVTNCPEILSRRDWWGSDIPMEGCCSRCWLLLVEKLQIIAVLSPALHFPWLSLKEHFPAPSTTFVTGRNNQTAQVFLRWVVDLTWILDLELFKHILWMSQSWTPYQSLHGIHLK